MDEKMSDLPKGWAATNLSEVVIARKGKKPKILLSEKKDGCIPYILIDEMEGKPIRSFTNDISMPTASEKDILVVWDGSIGKTATGLKGAIGSTIAALTPFLVETAYLESFIKFSKPYIEQTSRGTGLQHINPDYFWTLQVPLAPLNEQRRIVAKLEKLLNKVNTCKERLEKVLVTLKRFRQSVLAAACSGRLTADWREKNPDVESAEELLKKVKIKKKLLYEQLYAIAITEDRKKPSLFKKNTEPINIDDLIEIPKTWIWDRLVNITHIQGGVTKGRKFKNLKTVMLPYLRVANVQDGFLDLSEIKEIEALPEDIERYKLDDGDILFTEGGDRDKLGRGTVWRNYIKGCIHQNHIFRARLYHNSILSDYISLATKSDYARSYFFNNASQTVNLASINLTTLGNVPIAIPPQREQQEIVRRVEALFKKADEVEARYKKAKAFVDRLTQSILAKAFRGELVPQDPNDEPASVLLKRIKAEKARLEEVKKRKKGSK